MWNNNWGFPNDNLKICVIQSVNYIENIYAKNKEYDLMMDIYFTRTQKKIILSSRRDHIKQVKTCTSGQHIIDYIEKTCAIQDIFKLNIIWTAGTTIKIKDNMVSNHQFKVKCMNFNQKPSVFLFFHMKVILTNKE